MCFGCCWDPSIKSSPNLYGCKLKTVFLTFFQRAFLRDVAALRAEIEVPYVKFSISNVDNRERACAYRSNSNFFESYFRSTADCRGPVRLLLCMRSGGAWELIILSEKKFAKIYFCFAHIFYCSPPCSLWLVSLPSAVRARARVQLATLLLAARLL